ncbi:AAA family ATPase [Leptospira vanthielii]|uniref:DUF3696 domain-containing protein n=1 Tax=Leptospira vanthielii TaxID=293085 RepID=A0ABY2NU03_9LEPT|nr:DUF3696 domain-containing protein [Leptospira vanthielii]TGM61728.1 DUF3696 domain-containing protein [Leptospira vanthielii]
MIQNINLKNFKAFEHINLEFRPITLFLGPNNSGKSSILSSLRILSQTLQSYDQSVSLLLNGKLGDFGTYKDIVHGNNRQKHIEINITTDLQNKVTYPDFLKVKTNQLLMKLKYRYRSTIHELILAEIELLNGTTSLFSSKYSEKSEKHIIHSVYGKIVPAGFRSTLSKRYRLFHFLPNSVMFIDEEDLKDKENKEFYSNEIRKILREISRMCGPIYNDLMDIEYLGAMRLPPERTYLFSGERNDKVGSKGENASSILMMDSLRKGEKSKQIKEKVVNWLKQSQIASDIKIVSLSDRHYELYIQNPKTKEYQNYADVGYGNSQVIPVLVAGYNLSKNETLIVEEPEIHLHPGAQSELGDFFLELYKESKNSIIETHSEYLIVRLQQHIAAGKINPKDILFYYVHSSDTKKEIIKMNVDNSGAFLEEWPEGFFPQRLDEAKKLAKIRFELQKK